MNMIWAIRDSVRISFTGGTGMRRAHVVMALVLSFLFITILWGEVLPCMRRIIQDL